MQFSSIHGQRSRLTYIRALEVVQLSSTFSSFFFSFPGVGIDIALNDGDTHLNRRVSQDVLFTLLDSCLYMVCGFLGDQRRATPVPYYKGKYRNHEVTSRRLLHAMGA